MSRFSVLDDGDLETIEGRGPTKRTVEPARMNTGNGFLRWDGGPCPAAARWTSRIPDANRARRTELRRHPR